uniref:Type I polyketide synthase n=1 Tax=Gambierdiscus excentricus TaxID=986170 RepID=A0A1S6K872_9DINO|nr:type I polyketide synthase [Gambierdiscus excentricus]
MAEESAGGEPPPEEDQEVLALAWPVDDEAFAMFGFTAVEALMMKGYCLMRLPDADACRSAVTAAQRLGGFNLLQKKLEESLLGSSANCVIQWLDGSEPPVLQELCDHILNFHEMLQPIAGEFLGFRPAPAPSGVMARLPMLGTGEQRPVLEEADIADGVVAQHLDFIRRRRLCMMLMAGGGEVELRPRAGSEWPGAMIAESEGSLLVFRHDQLGYSYQPRQMNDLVLQAWILEEPDRLQISSFEGDAEGMQALMEVAAPIPLAKHVHVMSGMCNFPSAGLQVGRAWLGFAAMTDGFTEIPAGRWEMSWYYTDDPNGIGKSFTKHSALLGDDVLRGFDNRFFGIEDEVAFLVPPLQRLLLETSYEAFALAGWNRASLKGKPIAASIADIGADWDIFHGYQANTTAWLKASTIHSIPSAARLCTTLQLTGPVTQVDTACSSSLVSANIIHSLLRQHRIKEITWGLSMGTQNILTPWSFIGLSGAGMLGRSGRCLTFDQSANGYNRGEGCGGLLLKFGEDPNDIRDRLAVFVSSFINQDGRSASLTAPNGPSQQACVRGSLRDARVVPEDLNFTENHGTGTALGDPIEVGSIRACFNKRAAPLPITSGKSHVGHLESTAGSVGLVKVLGSLLHAAAPPNVHIRQLNAHIEEEGFPACWPTELTDTNTEECFGGLNSFGFGGTNSRGDLWATKVNGLYEGSEHKRLKELKPQQVRALDVITVTCPRCLGPMCWVSSQAAPDVPRKSTPICPAVREDAPRAYEHCSNCYRGGYVYGEPAVSTAPDQGSQMFMVGTWSAWSSFDEMEFIEDGGCGYYRGHIRLGDTALELFHLVLDRNLSRAIHPIVPKADQKKRVCGPSKSTQDRNWVIDGRVDGALPGAVYEVRLTWAATHKSISWKLAEGKQAPAAEPQQRHSYAILGSLTRWQPLELKPSDEDPEVLEFHGKMNAKEEEFLFLRDRDRRQFIYPLHSWPSCGPVMGPDEGGYLKRWVVQGEMREAVKVTLSIKRGAFEVTAATASAGSASWCSGPHGRNAYCLVGSWNGWACCDMVASTPLRHTARFTIGRLWREEFHFLVNGCEGLRLYPNTASATPGHGILCGPDSRGSGLNWAVEGPEGQLMEVVLDLDAEDNCRMVSCGPAA